MLAVCAASVSASAQWCLSGKFSFNSSSADNYEISGGELGDKVNVSKSTSFTISPEISYEIGDWEFGVGVGYSESNYDADLTDINKKTVGGEVFARRYFNLNDKFYLFSEAAIYGSVANSDWDNNLLYDADKVKSLNIYLVPGAGFNINEHWSIDAYLDIAAINYSFTKTIFENNGDATSANSTSGLSIYGNGFEAPVTFAVSYAF